MGREREAASRENGADGEPGEGRERDQTEGDGKATRRDIRWTRRVGREKLCR